MLDAVQHLDDDQLHAGSRLPGWTRAHVVAHVSRNAEALGRLATWARTGVESEMYVSRKHRDEQIEVSSAYPADRLRRELARTAEDLDDALGALDDDAWGARVRIATGREIRAAAIPWLRAREVWLHAVDLDAGVSAADLPADVADEMLDDVTGFLTQQEGCPPVVVDLLDRDQQRRIGPDEEHPFTVTGSAADALAWVTGRSDGGGLEGARRGQRRPPPTLPSWL